MRGWTGMEHRELAVQKTIPALWGSSVRNLSWFKICISVKAENAVHQHFHKTESLVIRFSYPKKGSYKYKNIHRATRRLLLIASCRLAPPFIKETCPAGFIHWNFLLVAASLLQLSLLCRQAGSEAPQTGRHKLLWPCHCYCYPNKPAFELPLEYLLTVTVITVSQAGQLELTGLFSAAQWENSEAAAWHSKHTMCAH